MENTQITAPPEPEQQRWLEALNTARQRADQARAGRLSHTELEQRWRIIREANQAEQKALAWFEHHHIRVEWNEGSGHYVSLGYESEAEELARHIAALNDAYRRYEAAEQLTEEPERSRRMTGANRDWSDECAWLTRQGYPPFSALTCQDGMYHLPIAKKV